MVSKPSPFLGRCESSKPGKYLGFHIKPKVEGSSWKAPAAKWHTRLESIANSDAGTSFSWNICSSKALLVLCYIAQLTTPSTIHLWAWENWVTSFFLICQYCHHRRLFWLGITSGPKIRRIKAACFSSIVRNGWDAVAASGWAGLRDSLFDTAIDCLPFTRCFDTPWPDVWESSAFVCSLQSVVGHNKISPIRLAAICWMIALNFVLLALGEQCFEQFMQVSTSSRWWAFGVWFRLCSKGSRQNGSLNCHSY